MASEWDEIRMLAADLQRAQSSSASQKLSERNCIEIVNKLIEMQMIDIVYTSDGKEYLTPEYLRKEILDEVYLAGGRMGIPELASILNVDFTRVEAQAKHLTGSDRRLFLVLGQLIGAEYLDKIAEEINYSLQSDGTISIGSLTKEYNLPAEFLSSQIVSRLGSIIEASQDEHDPKVLITPVYLARNKARVRGILNAITIPTSISSIANRFGVEGRLFMNLADELMRSREVDGTFTGGKQPLNATYVPNIYLKGQNDWVDNFFQQNSYLEYDALHRLGISDPASYAKRRLKDDGVTFLSSCCLGSIIVDNIQSSVEEALNRHSFVDVEPLLPSILNEKDVDILLQGVLKDTDRKSRDNKTSRVFAGTVVTSEYFVQQLFELFTMKINEKAEKLVQSGDYAKSLKMARSSGAKSSQFLPELVDKKEERRRKAASGGKGGGGTQGREGKTKSLKSKNKRGGKKGGDNFDSDDDGVEDVEASNGHSLKFMELDELEDSLTRVSALQDAPNEMFCELAKYLLPTLTKLYSTTAAEMHQTSMTASMHDKKKARAAFQEKVVALFDSIRLFSKGLQFFEVESDRSSLEKYLLKSLCTDLLNDVVMEVANNNEVQAEGHILSPEQRMKVINKLPKEAAEGLLALHKTLQSDLEGFVQTAELSLERLCDVVVRKPDKKKDRQSIYNHRQRLVDLIQSCTSPASLLHMVSLVLFQLKTGAMLHASGKFVPKILAFVSDQIDAEEASLLKNYQSLVMELIGGQTSEEEKSQANLQLEETMQKVKDVVSNRKFKSAIE